MELCGVLHKKVFSSIKIVHGEEEAEKAKRKRKTTASVRPQVGSRADIEKSSLIADSAPVQQGVDEEMVAQNTSRRRPVQGPAGPVGFIRN